MTDNPQFNPQYVDFWRSNESNGHRLTSAKVLVSWLETLQGTCKEMYTYPDGTKTPYSTIAQEVLEGLRDNEIFFIVSTELTGDGPPIRSVRGNIPILLFPESEMDKCFDLASIPDMGRREKTRADIRGFSYEGEYIGLEIATPTNYLNPEDQKLWAELADLHTLHMTINPGLYDRGENSPEDTNREFNDKKVILGRFTVETIIDSLRAIAVPFPEI